MQYTVPSDLRYTETHEWADPSDGVMRIGITDFAQDELGDIVFVELPDDGDELEEGDSFGVVESIKAVSDIHAPVSGTVVGTNEAIHDQPELINDEPFDAGWLIELESGQGVDDLLTGSEYENQL